MSQHGDGVWLYPNDSFERHNTQKAFVANRWLLTIKQIVAYVAVSALLSLIVANTITRITGYWTLGSVVYGLIIGVILCVVLLHSAYRKVDHAHPVTFWINDWWRGFTTPRPPDFGRTRVRRLRIDPKATTRIHYPKGGPR